MKNKGFTLSEGLGYLSIVSIIIIILFSALAREKREREKVPTQALEDVQIDSNVYAKIQGKIDGWPYIIFEDRNTHTKILYYRGAMTYLKSKTDGVKTNKLDFEYEDQSN